MRLPAVILVCSMLAGCAGHSPTAIHVVVGEASFEVFEQPETRNGQVAAHKGDTLEFIGFNGTHHLRIHHEHDPASTYLLDKDTPPGSALVIFELERRGAYQVWCAIHGGPGTGMHLDVDVG